MATFGSDRRVHRRLGGPIFSGALLLTLTAVGGCSQVPDAVNPAEWYKSTTDFFSGDKEEGRTAGEGKGDQSALAADRGKTPPGSDKPFPSLSSVPEGLASDRRERKYSSEVIRRQGEPVQSLAAVERSSVMAAAPPPPAISATPVARVPVAPPPAPALRPPSPPASSSAPLSVSTLPAHSSGLSEFAPPSSGGLMDTYQARLSQRRPAKSGSGAPSTISTSISSLPAGSEEFSTVIISSSGVEKGRAPLEAARAKPLRPATPPSSRVLSATALAEPRPAGKVAMPSGGALKVATIQFANGSAQIDAMDRGVLSSVYQLHRQRGGKLRIVGHASSRTRNMDSVSHMMVNYQVSVDRAEIVMRELVRLGADKDKVLVVAESDSSPMYYEIMPSGEAGNRRTEIYLVR